MKRETRESVSISGRPTFAHPCLDHHDLKTLHRGQVHIILLLEYLMSTISDFATAMNQFNDRQDKAVAALQGDVDNLTKQIAALQTSPGAITPEDQTLLDGIQARAKVVSDKLDALDALTPPVPPVA